MDSVGRHQAVLPRHRRCARAPAGPAVRPLGDHDVPGQDHADAASARGARAAQGAPRLGQAWATPSSLVDGRDLRRRHRDDRGRRRSARDDPRNRGHARVRGRRRARHRASNASEPTVAARPTTGAAASSSCTGADAGRAAEGGARRSDAEKPRLAPETIAPFARTLERTRRLCAAEARVSAELHALPSDAWLIEQYVLEDAHRIPFVVAGPTGVFVLCATDGGWRPSDL